MMHLDPSQRRAIDLMQSGDNVFLTGLAGTGKSTVVQQFLGSAFVQPHITATTGIAAINLQDAFYSRTGIAIRASTVYRWAGIGIGPRANQSDENFFRELTNNMIPSRRAAFRRIETAECLLIDEISMLPGRVLTYLDFHFREIRRCREPFGGLQLIVVGDFLQLPPVSKTGKYDWAFQSQAWADAEFVPCVLERIHRQDEPEFIDALNDFREGRIRGSTARLLASRVPRFPSREITRLFTHNTMVNKWNSYQLGCIEDVPEIVFTAEAEGPESEVEFLRKNMITPWELKIKEGARVMVTRNLSAEGELVAANGATGNVRSIQRHDGIIWVELDGGKEIGIERHSFHFDPMREESGKIIQYPLRLAYAMTIHKSQGLTLDSALIDIRAAREPGQAYVALSRLRSIKGLWLKDWIKGVFVSEDAINFHRNLMRVGECVGALKS